MKYVIQNILFPNLLVCNETKLYYKTFGSVQQIKNRIIFKENAGCSFSTYFNAFSLNKWLRYTKLNTLTLSLKLKGNFKVTIYSAYLFHEKAIRECINDFIVSSSEERKYEFPLDISKNDSLFFELTALSKNAEFSGGCYFTDIEEKDLNDVNIDLVMCTFKREKYVKRNIDLVVNDFIRASGYNGSSHFKIKVVDNGQTLQPEDIEVPGVVALYPNLNVGGSGGFCRGMIESLHDDFSTHILFMDDDVLIQTEALERTYNLLSILKDQYKNDFIGGAMFRLDRMNMQHENLSGFEGNHLVGLKGNLDLNHYKNVLFNEKIEPVRNIYAAWWFCCIPKTVANLHNLPYPFFIRMDDIEYSVRNIKNAISMNGISVWHEAFDKKYSTLMENYFMFRNNMVVNIVDGTGNKKMDLKFLARRFIHDIMRFDYNGAELLLDGVESFLKGPDFYKNVDTVADLKVHGAKQVKLTPIEDIKDRNMVYADFCADLAKDAESKFIKLLRFLTLNGHFLPFFLLKPGGFAMYGYGSNSKMYFRRKKVMACDPAFETAVELSMNRTRCIHLIIRWIKVSRKFICHYHRLEKEYKETFPEMISENFWLKYLKLDKTERQNPGPK